MGRTCCKPADSASIDDVVGALETALSDEVAEGALTEPVVDAACGALTVETTVAQQYDRRVALLGALVVASRRAGHVELTPDAVADAVGVDAESVAAAAATLARKLGPTAAPAVIESIRRRLLVAMELHSAAERGQLQGFELPGSYLADAAPELFSRLEGADGHGDKRTDSGLTADELQVHVERLEADLELARLGTTLYAAVHGDD